MIVIETFERGCEPKHRPTPAPATIRIDTSWHHHLWSTTAVTIAVLAGSQPAAPTLASVCRIQHIHRQSRDRSHRATGRCLLHIDARAHARQKTRRRDPSAPTSARPSPRQNPHSTRCFTAPHLTRFRALALFGRRPPVRVAGCLRAGIRKPAHKETSRPSCASVGNKLKI